MNEIDLKNVKICKDCGVLFIPKEIHYHTCPHCFEISDIYSNDPNE